MGALQPGLPSPSVILRDWPIVIDLKDCFFMTALHPDDSASESHAFFHQNTAALSKDYGISMSQACMIVNACPKCQRFSSPSAPRRVAGRG
ncbi:POK18 protein, partial [Mystacornis crossleyi]|nr:POK18 protein [Mystacornis crossleyi]